MRQINLNAVDGFSYRERAMYLIGYPFFRLLWAESTHKKRPHRQMSIQCFIFKVKQKLFPINMFLGRCMKKARWKKSTAREMQVFNKNGHFEIIPYDQNVTFN